MIASSPTVSAQDNTTAVPAGTKQDQHNPFSFSLAKWNNFKETIPGSPSSPGKIKRQPLRRGGKNGERGVPPLALGCTKCYGQL